MILCRHPGPSMISTHAPLARCDPGVREFAAQYKDFNSRTSCEVRRATPRYFVRGTGDFNSRTSCEVRRLLHCSRTQCKQFQLTHLLRGATITAPYCLLRHVFQLTHLLRGATTLPRCSICGNLISTHAPLARCDTVLSQLIPLSIDFNSRTSCEVRLHAARGCAATRHFNSRTSCEVRRAGSRGQWRRTAISTHAPLARCDIFPTLGVI